MKMNFSYSLCQRQSPFRIGLLLIMIGIFLASCNPAEESPDPISVVQEAINRLNEDNLDGFMELFSDDAVAIDERVGRIEGAKAIRRAEEFNVIPYNLRFEISNPSSEGNVVIYTLKVYKDDYLIVTYTDALDVVVDGKIIFEGSEDIYIQECERDPSQAFCQ